MNQIAASLVAAHTGQPLPVINSPQSKNPAAVALGRLGGLKGGKARAAALSKKRRKQIAQAAASARWSKTESDG
jgi:hypothetical protein